MFTKESQFLSENVYYICFSFPQSYYLRKAFEQTKRKIWEYQKLDWFAGFQNNPTLVKSRRVSALKINCINFEKIF